MKCPGYPIYDNCNECELTTEPCYPQPRKQTIYEKIEVLQETIELANIAIDALIERVEALENEDK